MKTSGSVKTIDRLVSILECFSPEHPTRSLAELHTRLQLPKSTLHRFLVGLEYHGILRRDPLDRRWCPGYRLLAWGSLASETVEVSRIARPIMRDLVKATGETAIVTVYDNQQVVCIDKLETSQPVRMTLQVGSHRAPHAGASSKILMAYLPDEEIQAIIRDKGLPKLCTNTITDRDELMAELATIRAREYAQSLEETDRGAWGVATAVFDRNGRAVAAIGVAGPSSRCTDGLAQYYAELCQEAARGMSAQLYGEPGFEGVPEQDA